MRGDNVHTQDNFGETALHYAAANGLVEVVELLLSYGADTKAIDTAGQTPFDCAKKGVGWRWQRIAKLLLEPYPIKLPLPKQRISVPGGIVVETFWIDSVCFNQVYVLELNAEVALMTQIFGSSVSIRIWLGNADEKAIMALLPVSVNE
jgi:hypothetical protein